MKVTWNDLARQAEAVLTPNLGERDDWSRWYRESWASLEATGQTEASSLLDLAKVKLRAFALVWLATDFVAAGERCDDDDIILDWDECQTVLDIPSALLPFIYATADRGVLARVLDPTEFAMEWDLPDVAYAELDEEVDSEEALRSCSPLPFALCAYLARKEIVATWEARSGGLERVCCDMYLVIGLTEMVETIICELRDRGEEIIGTLSEPISEDERLALSQELTKLTARVRPDSVHHEAKERLEDAFLSDADFAFPGDEGTTFHGGDD